MERAQPFDRLHVHGGGRRGEDAWPHVTDPAARFVSFAPDTTIDDQVAILVDEIIDRRTLVFAHSIGAVPAVLATARRDPAGLVLIEPALYDIARGDAAIERHIAIVTEARALASSGDIRGFWAILRPLMFGGPFDSARWHEEEPLAQRWATVNLPWGHGVREQMLDGIPTLVVTGGWNAEYERIAAILDARGAQHVVIDGAAHRPQDLPPFRAAVEGFERTLG